MISVLILTKNEEQDLPGCLESIKWCDDIHIFDSGSTDSTTTLAKEFGAIVTQHSYENTTIAFGGDEAAHRNWGLRNIPFKNPWVLQLDADERATPELYKEIINTLPNSTCTAYRIQRRDFLMGRWLKRTQASPYYIRLFRPEKIQYERLINPVSKVDGKICDLQSYFEHHPFSKGISHWLAKHNDYSTLEAKQIVENRKNNKEFSFIKSFTEKNFNERRFHQKEIFYQLPFRPFIKFLILYIGKCGFLDGRAGFTYSILQSFYEYMIVLKTREITDNS